MKKVLIEFDEAGYNSELSTLHNLANQLTQLINQFNSIGIGELNLEDINLLFSDPEKLAYEKIMNGRSLEVGNITLNKQKFFEIIEKPASYYPYLEKMKKIIASLQALGQSQYTAIYQRKSLAQILGLFDFSDLTAIAIKPGTIDQVKELYEKYAVSEEAKLSFELATQLNEFFNKSELFKKMGLSERRKFDKFIQCIDFVPGKGTRLNITRIQNAATNFG